MDFGRVILGWLLVALGLCLLFLLGRWAVRDARQRGATPWLVCAAVVLFFPAGWLAWVAFRPGVVHRDVLRVQRRG